MTNRYYSLLVLEPGAYDESGKRLSRDYWTIHFGDFDYDTVADELMDFHNSADSTYSDLPDWTPQTKIVVTDGAQANIDSEVAFLNQDSLEIPAFLSKSRSL